MNTDSSKPCELDTVVIVYFGQDCDLIDEDMDFNNLFNDYLETSTPFNLRMLLANLTEIEEQSDGYDVLLNRYRGEFAPDRWDLSPQEWVKLIKQKTIEKLHKEGHSSELSHF
ncbi:contact-dependent growth inhibition system immunity protein [Erwinia sp. HDF1-3R]|uniref:contact-dependent growth inhibition system immunity protein n=1 Tax=Erwinia sp. HDF1-3R TaxID=3141543 RepID=UPI0031F57B2B